MKILCSRNTVVLYSGSTHLTDRQSHKKISVGAVAEYLTKEEKGCFLPSPPAIR